MLLLMKILLDNLKGLSGNGDFSFKKGYFQRLISRLRKLTLISDLHQWKIWTFYLPCIPSLGGWRINGLPTKRSWSQPTFVFSKSLKYIMKGGFFSSINSFIDALILNLIDLVVCVVFALYSRISNNFKDFKDDQIW